MKSVQLYKAEPVESGLAVTAIMES